MSRSVESKLDPRRDRLTILTVRLQMLDLQTQVNATKSQCQGSNNVINYADMGLGKRVQY